MIHGQRKTYYRGCRCRLCRLAAAAYMAERRRRAVRGALTGRQLAIEARKRVRQLEREGYPKTRIAKLAGWKDGRAYHVTFRRGQRIRRQTYERIVRVARYAMLEGV